jgi:hypothetical protein
MNAATAVVYGKGFKTQKCHKTYADFVQLISVCNDARNATASSVGGGQCRAAAVVGATGFAWLLASRDRYKVC